MTGPATPYTEPGSEQPQRKTLLVICETWDGRAAKASLDLAGEARSLADRFDAFDEVTAAVIGAMEDPGGTLGACGVRKVYHYCEPQAFHDTGLTVSTISQLIPRLSPALVLCAHTPWGADLAPRLATALKMPLISNCVEIIEASHAGLSALQSVHNGRLHRECSAAGEKPIIVSWNTDSLGRYEPREQISVPVEELAPAATPASDAVRSMGVVEGDPESMPLEEADRIVAFGRGMNAEDLPVLRELANLLRASLGGTRPVIDAGLLPFERQIGQTGVTVSPGLLIAWGISGANEFTVGMEDAHTIVSVNTDARARMFMFSDLGLVGDGGTILRRLMDLLAEEEADSGASPGEAP